MNQINYIAFNHTLICAIVSWISAQLLKILFLYLSTKKISLKRFWGSGGMPSSHTSVVVSVSSLIGIIHGFTSDIFTLSFVLSCIVMYDAMGVRRETGTQAIIINKILKNIFEGEKIFNKDLKELVGHTPLEVLGGFILGVIVAFSYNYIFII